MFEPPVRTCDDPSAEENLRARLARGDMLAGTVQPILRHLLNDDNAAFFSDEIVARVRAMAAHLARQLSSDTAATEGLTKALLDSAPLLTHLHALALEWQLAQRLEQRFGVDVVTPPFLQALTEAPEAEARQAGAQVLGVQAQWAQAQRRMQLPLTELPGDLLQAALVVASQVAHDELAAARVRAAYDEGANRLGLMARLLTGLGDTALAALDLGHAGLALFLSALAIRSRQPRDELALATQEPQITRLALALRAAGLSGSAMHQQLLLLHPDLPALADAGSISAAQAAALLADARGPHP